MVFGGKLTDELFDVVFFGHCDDLTAIGAADVMMMVGKGVAQFYFVFPADVNTLHDAELFEQRDGAV